MNADKKRLPLIIRVILCLWPLLIIISVPLCRADVQSELATVLAGVEKRYAGNGFVADFFQHSTLKAMDISDSAKGRIWVKRPGKMRWEYSKPERQVVVTNGRRLWIYRPLDNQVMIGEAPDMFGQGKGAAFLSDMNSLREKYRISLEKSANPDYWRIRLIPRNRESELAQIDISISRKTFQADQIVTWNAYGDETRIIMSNYDFKARLPDNLFEFIPPKGVDIVELHP